MSKIYSLAKQYAYWPEIVGPYQKNIDFYNTPINDIFSIMDECAQNKKTDLSPNIFQFYAFNEIINYARKEHQEILPKEYLQVYEDYQHLNQELSQKIFSYIFVCSFAEARYCTSFENLTETIDELREDNDSLFGLGEITAKDFFTLAKSESYQKAFDKQTLKYKKYYSSEDEFNKFCLLFKEIHFLSYNSSHLDRDEIQAEVLNKYTFLNLKSFTVGELLHTLCIIFEHNDFEAGYGGASWAKIAKHGLDFCKGLINSEVFIDQSFSLQHNGGNIFSKNFIFSSIEDEEYFSFNLIKLNNKNFEQYGVSLSLSELILNTQHSHGVLSLLSDNYSAFKKITDENKKNFLNTLNDLNLSEKPTLKQQKNFFNSLEDLYKEFQLLKKNINKNNKDFIQKYKHLFPKNKISKLNSILFPDIEQLERSLGPFHAQNIQSCENFLKFCNHFNSYYDTVIKNFSNKFNYYELNDLSKENAHKEIIGSKALGLYEMSNLGMNVPKFLVLDTQTCMSYLKNSDYFNVNFSNRRDLFEKYLQDDKGNSKMVSIRSGAPKSMPGMMDTILNVGIDDSSYDELVKQYGKRTIDECVFKFMTQFCESTLDQKIYFPKNLDKALDKFASILITNNMPCDRRARFPLDKVTQIELSIKAVFNSWKSPRAQAWRAQNNIDYAMGTAAIVQQMVLGNLNDNSLTGVVFSRDCISGSPGMIGEYLPCAQGEDVVSGSKTPYPLKDLKKYNPTIYSQLQSICTKLEETFNCIQDIEFTVEDGKLYILQHREAVCSEQAKAQLIKNLGGNLTKNIDLNILQTNLFVTTQDKPDHKGLSASPGVIQGILVQHEKDIEKFQSIYENNKNPHFGWIFYSKLAQPHHAPMLIKTDAFLTQEGGNTSHAAILSRSLKKPCVVAIGDSALKTGDLVTLNAYTGEVWKGLKPIVEDNKFASFMAKTVLKEAHIDDKNLDVEKINQIKDEMAKKISWMQILPKAKMVKHIEKNKFLNIHQKAAMLIVKQHKQDNDNKKKTNFST